MAGLVLGASSALPASLLEQSPSKTKSLISAFEKEFVHVVSLLRKGPRPGQEDQFVHKSSNLIFNLWSSYESRLPPAYFSERLLMLGDLLYQTGQYTLAQTLCYSHYLQAHYNSSVPLLDTVTATKDNTALVTLLRALIGDAVCQYHMTREADNKLMHVGSRRAVLKVLHTLQLVSQAGLTHELLYWITHNCLLLMFSICRSLMSHSALVLEYLVWGCVCMESSVPLMASKYLSMRANFYTAVCQCFLSLRQPHQAELFARRALDKVHELAQLEGSSTAPHNEHSELAFKEASLKLGVIIFKRSVFLSRKKLRPGLRPKVRPALRELLQQPCPRSPTERLLSEMFTGSSTQFLAVLETLTDSSHRPLHRGPPPTPPDIDLDHESITDVYQELFCIGLDLALQALESGGHQSLSGGLLSCGVRGDSGVPLESLVQFVRLSYSCDQREVVEVLFDKLVQDTQVSDDPGVRSRGKSLELLLMVDSLTVLVKKFKSSLSSASQPTPPNTATTASSTLPTTLSEVKEDPNTTAEELFSKLQEVLSLLHLSVGDQLLVDTDFDLLLDSAVYVWEVASPVFSIITAHSYTSCKQFLAHPNGSQYLVFLAQLVEVFSTLELWRTDPLLNGELCLKLACLYEARAQLRATAHLMEGFPLLYDRSLLLECLSQLERDVVCVERARSQQCPDDLSTDLESLHAQFLVALTRVRVKLSTTIPPPSPSEGTTKPSSLKSKVLEREQRVSQRARVLSQLTAPTVCVPSVPELRGRCGSSHYKTALLTLLQASLDPRLSHSDKESLLEESLLLLSKKTHKPPPTHTAPRILPPPHLLHASDTSMTFDPHRFSDEVLMRQVAYYKLYGRLASGSNVRVRVADQGLPGLGVAVSVGGRLCVHGLQPNCEYVFAVGPYTHDGVLVGGTIGATSQPILSSFSYPLLIAWGELCKSAYVCGAHSLAEKACHKLWTEFVEPSSDDEPYQLCQEGISSAPHSVLREFVQSVFIYVQLVLSQGGLLADRLCAEGPLRPSQVSRLRLAERLMVALEVSAMLNDEGLCLQAAVMVYGVLAPLIQYSVRSKPLLELLLRCYAVIGEVPEALHLNKKVGGLHHMIAVLGYFLGTVATNDNKRRLFSLVTDNARSLLIASMPVSTKSSDPQPSSEGLHQASLLSGSHHPSMASVNTLSSGLPALLPQTGQLKKKKLRAKKLVASIDEVSDESKSSEFRAFEGFLLCHVSQTKSDELDLTGQEDPVLLHAVIATQTSTTAHREVHKFRKRPQYLEYLVHLANATLSKGYTEKVMEWCREAFAWLRRRNDLLLSIKSVLPPAQQSKQEPGKQLSKRAPQAITRVSSGVGSSLNLPGRRHTLATSTRVSGGRGASKRIPKDLSTLGSSLNLPFGKRPDKPVPRQMSSCGSSMNMNQFRRQLKASGATPKLLHPHTKASQVALAKLSPSKVRRLQPIISNKGLSTEVRVTRDDVEAKAYAVIISLLPTVWKKHRARKRLRSVCLQELPWRAQANLIQASCYLDQLEKRLTGLRSEEAHSQPPLTFDAAGVIIDGVLPVYERAVAGQALTQTEEKQSLPVSELCQMFQHFQRAVTLAHRGSHWLLLQNTARSLLNALTCLTHLCSQLHGEHSGLLAAVYGEGVRPLYSTVNGLLDMLLKCGTSLSGCVLPEAPSLQYTPLLDECDSVGMGVVKRLVFLTLHTLFVHSHWEKAISIIVKFDDITKHSWGEQLAPVLTSAQSKLASRLSKVTVKRVRIEPAAHLDPGPQGYDVYGGVGHALGLTAVPLDAGDRSGRGTRGELTSARQLRMRYLSGVKGQVPVGDVITAYDQAVQVLGAKGDSDLLVQAMNELGDLIAHSSTSSSSQWWGECLCLLLGTRDPLSNWRKRMDNVLSSAGPWGCLVAASIAVKLARHVHSEELDVRLEYTLLSASLCKAALSFSLPTPTSDLSFIDYPTHTSPFPGVELFSDEHRLSPHTVLSTVSWVGQELLTRHHTLAALPVLWLLHHVAHTVCRDTEHTVLAKLLRLQALTQLHRFEEALFTLSELLVGGGLPQGSSGTDKHMDIHWAFHGFSNSFPVNDTKNLKCVQSLADRALSPSLAKLYGPVNVQLFSLLRAQLNIALAASISPLHHTSVVSRTGERPVTETARPASSLAPSMSTAAPSVSTLQVGGTPSPRQATPSSAYRRTKGHSIKVTLLDSAERQLAPLCEADDFLHPDLQIRAFLRLAEVASVYSHQSAALRLSLAALRTMQCNEYCYDPVLWLEGLSSFTHSLIGRRPSGGELLDCEAQCASAVGLCETLGEHELGARFHYTVALHHMSLLPQSLDTISKHCQAALELLEKVPVLSPDSALLRCQATLLLTDVSCVPGVRSVSDVSGVPGVRSVSDVSCVPGVSSVKMVEVFRGLEAMLKHQLESSESESGHPNIYLPHRLLLAATLLRLTHTLCLTERGSADSALSCCREGLSLLKSSSQSDPCLQAELLLHQGWLWSLTDEQAGISSLLEASTLIAECGIHPRLAVSTFYKLSELSTITNKQSAHVEPSATSRSPSPERRRSSRASLVRAREVNKSREKGRLYNGSWLLLKLGVKTTVAMETMLQFVSQVNNDESVKPLPLKVTSELPDFAVLDLCSTEELTSLLTYSANPPPVKSLLPSSQTVVTTGLNMFKIAGLFRQLTEMCSWQKPSLGLSHSNWQLHHHPLTPSIYPKAKALLDFLSTYSQQFRSLKIPAVPGSLFPVKPSTPEPCVMAGDTELTVVWTNPFPLDSIGDDIIGYFAMNAKSIRSQSASNSSQTGGVGTHTVRTTVRALEELCRQWEVLGEMASSFIEGRPATRPVSRSPTKQKKSEKALKVPPEIVDGCVRAVDRLKAVLGLESTESPRLDLPSMSAMARLLRPHTHTTVKGELYHFFKALFG